MGSFRFPAPVFDRVREWSHEDVFDTLVATRKHSDSLWWLSATQCSACGQAWLVGPEETQNDIFCGRRLDEAELQTIEADGRWPNEFKTYERLLQIGHDAGRSVRHSGPHD